MTLSTWVAQSLNSDMDGSRNNLYNWQSINNFHKDGKKYGKDKFFLEKKIKIKKSRFTI